MRNVISAEWTKLLPHKGTWMLVWIYPIFLLVILLIGLCVRIATGGPSAPMSAEGWIEQTAAIWNTPQMGFGCYLIAGYFAIVFAGEYGWNTWKLVIPHAARWKLIAAKYAVTLGLLYLAWLIAALIAVAVELLKAPVLGAAIPSGVTIGALIHGHLATLALGIAPLLVTAAYASVAAVLTRSTLAALIISIVLITIDEAFDKLIRLFVAWGMDWMTLLYRALPGYHLDNLHSWMEKGVGFVVELPGNSVAYSQTTSLLVLAAWIGGLAAVTFLAFRRQDIN
jgi:ABC-2 type transport system permease protein